MQTEKIGGATWAATSHGSARNTKQEAAEIVSKMKNEDLLKFSKGREILLKLDEVGLSDFPKEFIFRDYVFSLAAWDAKECEQKIYETQGPTGPRYVELTKNRTINPTDVGSYSAYHNMQYYDWSGRDFNRVDWI